MLMRGSTQSDLGFVEQSLGVFLSLSVLVPRYSNSPISNKSPQLVHCILSPDPGKIPVSSSVCSQELLGFSHKLA